MPFGEYVPLRGFLDALGAPVDQVPTNAVPGPTPAVIDLPDGTRLGVVISWEVFFGGRAREGVEHGGGVIVNPTNGASYTGTILQTQQVASSRLRAIETGRWVVQAAPTGFSAFVSPDGDVIDRTAVSEQAVIRHRLELRTGRTWYVRIGDRPFIVAARSSCSAPPGVLRSPPDRDAGTFAVSMRWGRQRSTISVTGPSLTSATGISVRNRPVATVAPSRRSSSTTASTSGSACSGRAAAIQLGRRPADGVAVERELADDEQLAADIGGRAVHHPGVVIEHPEVPQLLGHLRTAVTVVVVGDADQHAQPAPDRADHLAADAHRGRVTRCTTARTRIATRHLHPRRHARGW